MRTFLFSIGIILLVLPSPIGSSAPERIAVGILPEISYASGRNSPEQDQAAAKGAATISVDVDLVTVDVTLEGSPGRDLRAEDFVLFDNGVAQEVTHFSRDELPLTVALVVDISGSIASYRRELQNASHSTLRSLKAEDRVVLFGFGTYTSRFSDLTQDYAQLSRIIGNLKIGGSTNICDALFIAARYLREKAPRRRRAIILISDNGHNISWGQTWDGALQETLEAGATLYGIHLPGARLDSQKDQVREVARSTGGDVLDVGTGMSLTRALNASVANLRQQYTLGFAPSGVTRDGSFHRLDVRLRDPGACPKCRLLARRGYYARIPSAGSPAYVDRQIRPGVIRVDARIYNRLTIAAADMDELKDLPFEIAGSAVIKASQPQSKVDLRIDASAVGFRFLDGRYTARLYIGLFFGVEEGSFGYAVVKIMDLKLKEETYLRMKESGIPFSESVPGPRQFSRLKAVVFDPQSEKVGSRLLVVK
jgi:Ca-activated chloride channel homolog